MKKILTIGITIIVILVAVIGGKVYMDQKKLNEEMVKVVKSEEAKKVFEEGLKNIDPKALTKEGVIKSYEINYDSIKHNPMGGIMVDLYINDDKELYVNVTMEKDNVTGKLDEGGGGISAKLVKKLGR